jgi:hypothetical protein
LKAQKREKEGGLPAALPWGSSCPLAWNGFDMILPEAEG